MKRWGSLLLLVLLVALFSPGMLGAQGVQLGASSAPASGADSHWVPLNLAWVLIGGFLVFFMQVGFALMETGLTRAKNAAHVMMMNVMVFCVGALGFWVCGFALMFGHHGPLTSLGETEALGREAALRLGGKEFGLFGCSGFFLAGHTLDSAVLAFFFFQTMFMDTAATIPTGALAERWKFLSFVIFSLFVSTLLYPVYGNWVWGDGWLAHLGTNFGLGHGHVDFAGSSVVHMLGGVAGLAGAIALGPRIGKYRPDGVPNPLPAHSVPMYMSGTLFLAFGWFGFNTGSTLSAADPNIARIAVNTALAGAAGAVAAMCYLWSTYQKPDPSFLCNGLLGGFVSITAGCAYVAPWAAVLIGAAAGVLTVWSCLFVERVLRIDDPVGAVSVHGTAGAWGVLAVGLFADGTYAPGGALNGVPGNVTGLFYGNPWQFVAQVIGVAVNFLWVFPVAYGFFHVTGRLLGNRVSPQVEVQGLDVPELGALGYIMQDPKAPENRYAGRVFAEPRPAIVPPNGYKRFTVLVEGLDREVLTRVWSELCQAGERPPPPEFRAVYPYMTTVQGNRFRFRGGDPHTIRDNLERLLRDRIPGQPVQAHVEG